MNLHDLPPEMRQEIFKYCTLENLIEFGIAGPKYMAEIFKSVSNRNEMWFKIVKKCNLDWIKVASKFVDVNYQNSKGRTALHILIRRKNRPCFEYLLTHGANVNIQDKDGFTPLHSALQEKCEDFLNTLINVADLNVRDKHGFVPLHYSIRLTTVSILKNLIKYGAEVNAQANDGWTALHIAAVEARKAHVRVLCQAGASPNLTNNSGEAPLHVAVMHKGCLVELIKAKANLNLQTSSGQTALHIAIKNNSKALLSLNGINELIYIGGNIIVAYSYLLAPIGLVLLTESFQPIFVLIIGLFFTIFFPKIIVEKIQAKHIWPKIIAICITGIGTYLLFMK
jgi:ankyrin repeat protein